MCLLCTGELLHHLRITSPRPSIHRTSMSSCLKLPCGVGSSSVPVTSASSSSSSSSSSCSCRPQSSLRLHPEVQRVPVAILGARGVGKTALVRQFVRCEFREDQESSKLTEIYFTSIVVNERIYEVNDFVNQNYGLLH